MSETVEFDLVHKYNLFEEGITLGTVLRRGDLEAVADVKIDTGSTYCIFERYLGESLDIEIEQGSPLTIGTVTGSFRAFGHELTLIVLGLEFTTTVFFAESDRFDRNVLGRAGWLNRVKFGLIEPEGKLLLSSYR